jgi:hypothetical protein
MARAMRVLKGPLPTIVRKEGRTADVAVSASRNKS